MLDGEPVGVRRVASGFWVLLQRDARSGFLELVRPLSFEERCAEHRTIRDAEEFAG